MLAVRWCLDKTLPITCVVAACLGLLAHAFVIDLVQEQEAERLAQSYRLCDLHNDPPDDVSLPGPMVLAGR